MKHKPTFIDLFAGAGGLSEGFIRAGFQPIAHVESDTAACNTLRTRTAYHWYRDELCDLYPYYDYLYQNITRDELWGELPGHLLGSVINEEIGDSTLSGIFSRVDELLDGRKLDMIIGGPPCQAYSIIGRSRDSNRMVGDSRNYLYKYYAEFLKRYQPRFFLFENVLGLLSARANVDELYLDLMKESFREAGYTIEPQCLNAADYGVPQIRKRLIIFGKHIGDTTPFPFPDKTEVADFSVRDVFADLPYLQSASGSSLPCGCSDSFHPHLADLGIRDNGTPVTQHVSRPHCERDLEIYRLVVVKWNSERSRLKYNELPDSLKTHRNRESFLDRFKVIAADEPHSHTVVAHIAKDGHYYIHPDIEQNRSITPREAARLQTFPDDYYFEGISEKPSRTAAYRQIGNAVPVHLSTGIAITIWSIYEY